jgi:hypothetical protein
MSMIRRQRALRILVSAAVAMSASAFAAKAQGFGRSRGNSGPPVENRPKVDEKAYKAALDRIPVPTEKYDPWGGARAADPAKPPKKSN